jgi:hypothetical protein
MNARSILLALGTASMLMAGCAANAGPESTGSEGEAALKGPGPLYPIIYNYQIGCGSEYALGSDTSQTSQVLTFEGALKECGCGTVTSTGSFIPGYAQHQYVINGSAAQDVVYCPLNNGMWGWTTAVLESPGADSAPVNAVIVNSAYTACSGYKNLIPAGYAEIGYDPNCTGASCETIVRTVNVNLE